MTETFRLMKVTIYYNPDIQQYEIYSLRLKKVVATATTYKAAKEISKKLYDEV